MTGKFIVIYGVNNLGKTTIAQSLVEYLNDSGVTTQYFKYPLYDLLPTGPRINAYLRESNPENLTPSQAQEIFAQNRRDYQEELQKILNSGVTIVAEDYVGTGMAWGLTAGVERLSLDRFNQDLLSPDLAILVDGERFVTGVETHHKHESDNTAWRRCRQIHLQLATEFGWPIVNANQTREAVLAQVIETVEKEGKIGVMPDPIFKLIKQEEKRQRATLMLIPSENYAWPEVLEALGSCLTNKYAEGYPGRRYYQGNVIVDEIENLAIARAKKLFGTPHANVQPYSGSPANQAVYLATCNVGDKILGMDLAAGGHLTNGAKVSFAGRLYQSFGYGVSPKDKHLDYEDILALAKKNKPKLIWAGATAYPRLFAWEKFAEIANEVGAYLAADISHYAGLIAGGAYPSPVNFADIITTTTHKTLRGPRGAIIMVTQKGLCKDPDLAKKIDRAVFPGLQGGPHLNNIAAMAIALHKASLPEFKLYARQVVKNAQALAQELLKLNFDLVTGGTDNHLLLIDLRNKKIDGKEAAVKLEEAGIVVNANAIPFDPAPPLRPSGIRLGTPAVTAFGMKEKDMRQIARKIRKAI